MDNNSSFKDHQQNGDNAVEIEIKEVVKPYLRKYYWFIISAILFLIISYL
jgi:hypothetical protein